jgi:hypothetical protein
MSLLDSRPKPPRLAPEKFRDPAHTATGAPRAAVAPAELLTLWVNTGTLCNIACANCYIESSPRNDSLVYPTAAEIEPFIREAQALGAAEIGFTGGEPFMNRELPAMLEHALWRGLRALVLTNAMRPMRRHGEVLQALRRSYGAHLVLRVSLDHHEAARHDLERGAGSFEQAMGGLEWLSGEGFTIHVAARAGFDEADEAAMRQGFAQLFQARGIAVDAADPVALMLFPEMDAERDVPEISTACWSILGKRPAEMMCASSRMVVKRRGAAAPAVVACTLLPHEPGFEMGATLAEAWRPVALNHPHCARFCVLGGASCSR